MTKYNISSKLLRVIIPWGQKMCKMWENSEFSGWNSVNDCVSKGKKNLPIFYLSMAYAVRLEWKESFLGLYTILVLLGQLQPYSYSRSFLR